MWILTKIKKSFRAVKRDICDLEEHQKRVKLSTNEWIIHLNSENQMLTSRIRALENKLEKIESDKIRVLRNLE